MPNANTFVQLDLATGSLYLFFVFFLGLVFWLNRESKREGYPLVSDRPNDRARSGQQGFPGVPPLKLFKLSHPTPAHGEVRVERDISAQVKPMDPYPGSPIIPTGNPMQDGIGPAAYADRADVPDLAFDDEKPKIIPLRAAIGFSIDPNSPDPRGKPVITLDKRVAGTVVDLWVDRSDMLLRYLEVETLGGGRRVIVPMFLATISDEGTVRVVSVTSAQLAAAPAIRHPEQITLLEEDKVSAYFGGGHFYATAERNEPFL